MTWNNVFHLHLHCKLCREKNDKKMPFVIESSVEGQSKEQSNNT